MSWEDGTLGERGMDRRGWQLSCYRGYYREKETMQFCGSLGVGKRLGADLRGEFHERRFLAQPKKELIKEELPKLARAAATLQGTYT